MIAIVAHKRKSLGAVSCMGGSLTVPTAQSSRIPPICGSTTVPDDTLRLKGGADPLGDDYATMRTAWLSGNAGGSHSSPGRPAVSLAGQPAAALPANAGGSYSSPGMPATSPSGHSASALQAKQKQTRPPWFHGAKARSPAERAAVGGARGRGGGCRIVLSLSTNTTFAAKSSFPPKGVTEAYTRAGGRYDGEQKRWVFPLEKYEWVVEELGALKRSGQVKLDEIPPKILEAFRAAAGEQPPPLQILAAGASQDKDKAGGEAVDDAAVGEAVDGECEEVLDKAAREHGELQAVPAELREALMPFQREGVLFGLARGGRVLIGDEMGLGKTLQAIAIAAAFADEWPLLVVCPSSMRGMWEQELLKWLPSLSPHDVNVVYTGRDELSAAAKVSIISYDLFAKMKAAIDECAPPLAPQPPPCWAWLG
jgi:hypothetical protein